MSDETKRTPKVIIIGAGVGGISMAIALKTQLGYTDFTIYEKGDDVGGTWRDNTYPGCSSDIPIHSYSLSTALNPAWPKTHGLAPDIRAYWADLARQHSLYPAIQFRKRVAGCTWDATAQAWDVDVQDVPPEVNALWGTGKELQYGGKIERVRAEVVVSAVGILETPRWPTEIPGLKTFAGPMWHSARYDHSVELAGKRVGVIGNGCSAAQFVPIISKDPSVTLINFCRSPMWYVYNPHLEFSNAQRWIFAHVPGAMRLYRWSLFLRSDLLYSAFEFKVMSDFIARYFKKYMIKTAPEKYHEQMMPDYPPGCRRTVIDTHYLPALHRPNVSLQWGEIKEIVEDGIVTEKGEMIPLDVIILATGYSTNTVQLPLTGVNGRTLKEYYESKDGPQAYVGTTVPGFPNFYMLSGPNTVTGHASVIFTEECQIQYTLPLIAPVLRRTARSFVVTDAATDAYNATLQARIRKTVYLACTSWYRAGGTGKVTSPFPGPVTLFWWWTWGVKWGDYEVVGGERWRRRRIAGTVLKALVGAGLVGSGVWAWRKPEEVRGLVGQGKELLLRARELIGA